MTFRLSSDKSRMDGHVDDPAQVYGFTWHFDRLQGQIISQIHQLAEPMRRPPRDLVRGSGRTWLLLDPLYWLET